MPTLRPYLREMCAYELVSYMRINKKEIILGDVSLLFQLRDIQRTRSQEPASSHLPFDGKSTTDTHVDRILDHGQTKVTPSQGIGLGRPNEFAWTRAKLVREYLFFGNVMVKKVTKKNPPPLKRIGRGLMLDNSETREDRSLTTLPSNITKIQGQIP